MVFARDARSKKTYLDGHVDIRPLKYIPLKKITQEFPFLSLR